MGDKKSNGSSKPAPTVEVVIDKDDRSRDHIVVKSGDTIVKEIPAVIFDPQETSKLFEILAEPA